MAAQLPRVAGVVQLIDPSPDERPRRRPPRRDDLTFRFDRWFGRLLGMLGTIIAISLWLLAAEAVLLAITR